MGAILAINPQIDLEITDPGNYYTYLNVYKPVAHGYKDYTTSKYIDAFVEVGISAMKFYGEPKMVNLYKFLNQGEVFTPEKTKTSYTKEIYLELSQAPKQVARKGRFTSPLLLRDKNDIFQVEIGVESENVDKMKGAKFRLEFKIDNALDARSFFS